jgi:ribose-phosphate pyrophosphokinase
VAPDAFWHALLTDYSCRGQRRHFADPAIDRIIATDPVPAFRLPAGPVRDKLDVVPAAPLLAETIRRLHERQGATDLLVF